MTRRQKWTLVAILFIVGMAFDIGTGHATATRPLPMWVRVGYDLFQMGLGAALLAHTRVGRGAGG